MVPARLKNWNYNLYELPFGKEIVIYILDCFGNIELCSATVWEEFDRTLDSNGEANTYKCFHITECNSPHILIKEHSISCWKFAD
jgi:hypothetical protein